MTPAAANKLKLAVLVALFAAPVVLSFALYRMDWRPARMNNYGELVQPAKPIEDVTLRTLAGEPVRFRELQTKWALLYFVSGDCDAACERSLYTMRQVHVAQGRESDRVQRLLVLTTPAAGDRLAPTAEKYPGITVLTGEARAVEALVSQFAQPKVDPVAADRIYLLDPLGNWMMSYPAGADPSGMRKDLSRLLRVSQIG